MSNSLAKADFARMSAYELIDLLDKTHPPKNPNLTDPDRQIWYDAGKRDLVEVLINHKRREENG